MQPPFVHQVLMNEHDDFQPHASAHKGLPDTSSDSGVLLREDNGLLRVKLTVTPFGMPRRWRRPPAVRLTPGDWLRWQINYRFAGTHGGEWTYRLDTLNIANGPGPTNLFLGAPDHYVTELAALLTPRTTTARCSYLIHDLTCMNSDITRSNRG
jgi:hypothetical protein